MVHPAARRAAQGAVPYVVVGAILCLALGSCSSGGARGNAAGGARGNAAGGAAKVSHGGSASSTSLPLFGAASGPGYLQPGSDPSVLPGPLLIADRSNNRLIVVDPQGRILWEFPRPGDLAPGQTFLVPDDAFFTPDGKEIVATEEDDFVISVVDVASHKIVYRYGTPGVSGTSPEHLWNPDDAQMLPDGSIVVADIKNCRILLVPPGGTAPSTVVGQTVYPCLHDPPRRFGSPNGAFPMANGHYLVTEINGDWVDEMALDGTVYNAFHPPGIDYPSDTNEVKPGEYLTVDYSSPGHVETFDSRGSLVWSYEPLPGAARLDHPSLALPLPNGDVVVNDDHNDRVVVIDPRSNRVVWQYGVTGHPGSTPGLLDTPDGMDLAPPLSLDIVLAGAMAPGRG